MANGAYTSNPNFYKKITNLYYNTKSVTCPQTLAIAALYFMRSRGFRLYKTEYEWGGIQDQVYVNTACISG